MMTGLVVIQNKQAVTSSRIVAEKFGKHHRDILRCIREIIGSAQNCATSFFKKIEFIHPQNKQHYPEYLMNRSRYRC